MGIAQEKFNFGDFGSQPLCADWGFSRGTPVDRRYIEEFLFRYASDIRGKVLEIGGSTYTRQFGGDRVEVSEVLDLTKSNDGVTIIADLTAAPQLQSDAFDCIILTQVLERIFRFDLALTTIYRILKPGGIALITVPGISHISSDPLEASQWSWTFYPDTLRAILRDARFIDSSLAIRSRGNLRTTVAFMAGLAQEDLAEADFATDDMRYPLIVTAHVTKAATNTSSAGLRA